MHNGNFFCQYEDNLFDILNSGFGTYVIKMVDLNVNYIALYKPTFQN